MYVKLLLWDLNIGPYLSKGAQQCFGYILVLKKLVGNGYLLMILLWDMLDLNRVFTPHTLQVLILIE